MMLFYILTNSYGASARYKTAVRESLEKNRVAYYK